MLDANWDPYEAMINLDKNVQAVIAAHNLLAQRVEQQSLVIDQLITGINTSTQQYHTVINQLNHTLQQQLKDVSWPNQQ